MEIHFIENVNFFFIINPNVFLRFVVPFYADCPGGYYEGEELISCSGHGECNRGDQVYSK